MQELECRSVVEDLPTVGKAPDEPAVPQEQQSVRLNKKVARHKRPHVTWFCFREVPWTDRSLEVG